MKLTRIAIDGGPCAGKTVVMSAVKKEFGGQVLVMPEVATILLDNGFPKPGDVLDFSVYWSNSFQNSVLPVQLNMENQFIEVALRQMSRMVLFDRGLLSGAAYLEKGLQFFLDRFGLDEQQVYSRYDLLIHLESVAVSNPALYEKLKSTNPARYETAAQAAARDALTKEVWKNHPNQKVISGEKGIQSVIEQVLQILSGYLKTEIELKFKLDRMPSIPLKGGKEVRQGYFAVSQGEMRLRQIGGVCYITFKGDGDHERFECERSIDLWAFEQ